MTVDVVSELLSGKELKTKQPSVDVISQGLGLTTPSQEPSALSGVEQFRQDPSSLVRGIKADIPEDPSQTGLAQSMAGGLTFGHRDEIAARLNTLTNDKSYEENLATQRARDKAIPSGTRITGELLGGLATGGLAAPLAGARFVKNLPGWAKAAGFGGMFSGLYGAGASEKTGFEDVGMDAAQAAGLGALAGPLVYGGAKAIGAGLGAVRSAVSKRTSPADTATEKLSQALVDDALTPAQAGNRLGRLGPQGTLADAGRENVLGLGRQAAGMPGPSKTRAAMMLNQRSRSEGSRIATSVQKNLAADDFHAAEESFVANLRSRANVAYQKAYQDTTTLESGTLTKLMSRDIYKQAENKAKQLAAIEGRDISGKLTTETADDVKRGLDSIIEKNTNELTGRLNKKGSLIAKFKQQFLKEIDDLNPDYKAARKIYSDDAEVITALRNGRKAPKGDPENIAKELSGLSDAGKEAYRTGVARAIKDIVDNAPDKSSAAARLFAKSRMRERLRAVFPDTKQFNDFARTLIREERFASTRNFITGGSQTAPRQAESSDILGGVGQSMSAIAASKISGQHPFIMSAIGRKVFREMDKRFGSLNAYNTDMAKMLFTKDGQVNQQTIDRLTKYAASKGINQKTFSKELMATLAAVSQQEADYAIGGGVSP